MATQIHLDTKYADLSEVIFDRAPKDWLTSAERWGFWSLPKRLSEQVEAVSATVQSLESSFTDILLLGIGGSALGAQAIDQALRHPTLTFSPNPTQANTRRLHVLDNSDPWKLSGLLESLNPQDTVAIVISKSGGTLETLAQWFVVKPWFLKSLSMEQLRKRCVFITDPERGYLRQDVRDNGWLSLEVPSNVGGRYSVLSAVGLLPAALLGQDIASILGGAEVMRATCETQELSENPAWLFAAAHVFHHIQHGRNIHVLWPYSEQLRVLGAWYVQLWAESLGKKITQDGRPFAYGPTPIYGVGSTDQHSSLQLLMEGPNDKLMTFMRIGRSQKDITLTHTPSPLPSGFPSLENRTLSSILDAQYRGTRDALFESGRPSLTLKIDAVNADSLGQLMFFFEAATAFAGLLYNIDPFDQPGVELGKVKTFDILRK